MMFRHALGTILTIVVVVDHQAHGFSRSTTTNSRRAASPTRLFLFGLADDFLRKFKPSRTGKTIDEMDEAEVSASLYLNPAAEKIAPHVKVTWEPEAAETIQALARIRNPNRPLMVGVVGIPGSGKSTSCDILATYIGDEFKALVMPMGTLYKPTTPDNKNFSL